MTRAGATAVVGVDDDICAAMAERAQPRRPAVVVPISASGRSPAASMSTTAG